MPELAGTGRYVRTMTAIRLVNRIIETGLLEFDEPRVAGVTVRDAIEGFLAEQASRGMADSTLKSFRKFLIGSPNRAKCRNPVSLRKFENARSPALGPK
jgi:hypothetical protein